VVRCEEYPEYSQILPGIAKQYLPRDLSQSLVYYPGYDYLLAGKNVLLVNRTNQIIEDVLIVYFTFKD
jgi:hypothetical protein